MVAFYIRLSCLDDDLDERKQLSNSVENQRKLLTEYFDESPDLRTEDACEFIDDGYSGTNFRRPAFQKMLGLIKKRTIDTVIVKDFSRFGRNYIECADYIEKLFPFLGTRFISVSDNYDSGRREDCGIDMAMKNIVNSYYSQDLSRKVTSTFDLKRENGEFFFCAPFGYLKDETRPGSILVDDNAAEIVRHIFSLACEEGMTTCGIAKLLNRENIPTVAAYNREHRVSGKAISSEKSEFAAWTGTKVASILKNEVYAGTYISQKRRRVATGSRRTVPVSCPKKIPDNHPKIVDYETFECAQKIFKRVKRPAENRRYQLKSKVFCGNCGYAMTYQDNVRDECFFHCSHSRETGIPTGCPTERFPEELLNERVFQRLRRWMVFLKTAYGKAEEAEKNRQECLRLLGEEQAELRSELESLESKKLELYESYTDGEISRETLSVEKKKLSQESDSIKAELSLLHIKESTLHALRNRRKPELDDLMESVRLFENETRLTCKMAEAFVSRVTVHNKWQIEIEWKEESLAKEC
ncbi:MAG: recombinase family protein [Oscillospiraceae bacterium]|nr:recombinase family protein [Oscillospiraceae bacterium]